MQAKHSRVANSADKLQQAPKFVELQSATVVRVDHAKDFLEALPFHELLVGERENVFLGFLARR